MEADVFAACSVDEPGGVVEAASVSEPWTAEDSLETMVSETGESKSTSGFFE